MSTRAGYAGDHRPGGAVREPTGARLRLRSRHRGVDGVSSTSGAAPRPCRRPRSPRRVPTNKQRREAAQRRLQRQLERREQQARRRRRNLLVLVAAAAVLVVVGAAVLITNVVGGDDDATAAPASTSAPASASAAPAGQTTVAGPCTYTTDGTASAGVAVTPPSGDIATTGTLALTMATNFGDIGLALDQATAPCAAASFAALSQQGYFDNTPCHRETDSDSLKVLQCGDPGGSGTGGPGYTF